MVRLADLPEVEAAMLRSIPCEPFDSEPWVTGAPLRRRRVAIVTTAGLLRTGDEHFDLVDTSFRAIPGETTGDDLLMGHSSVNFDRSGFQQDVNVVFPIDRLRELAAAGEIGSLASYHYSFMSAGSRPERLVASAREVARMLKDDQVDAVLLCPV